MNSINLYQPIGNEPGEMSAEAFRKQVDAMEGAPFALNIHSPGGDVMEGVAIGTIIGSHPGKVTAVIEGQAASIASYIAVKCDRIEIAEDAWMMIHDPTAGMRGKSEDLRKAADQMDKFRSQLVEAYVSTSGLNETKVSTMMSEETWMRGADAVDNGFAHATVKKVAKDIEKTMAIAMQRFTNIPSMVASALNRPEEKENDMSASIAELKTACSGASADFILSQLEAKADLQSAVTAFATMVNKTNAELAAEIESLTAANAELTAKLAAMEEAPAEEEEKPAEPAAEEAPAEEEEEAPAASAEEEEEAPKARGAKPVARAKGKPVVSATVKWTAKVAEVEARPNIHNRNMAYRVANQENPTLRQLMVEECNAKRK